MLFDLVLENSEFGMQLRIKLIPEPGFMHVITLSKKSRNYNSFMERLIGINMSKPIELSPYRFKDPADPKKGNRGITVYQEGEKIPNQYKEKDEAGKNINKYGFPAWPETPWNELPEREQQDHLFNISDFLAEVLDDWRSKYAPDSDTGEGEEPPVEVEEEAPPASKDDLPF